MKQRRPVIEGSREVADMHNLRLMALLQELERDHGRNKAAELLGVDRRTLDTGLDEGVLSRRMRAALDRALQYGVGSAAAEQRDRNDEMEDRLRELEGKVEEQGKEMRVKHRALEDAIRAGREEHAQDHRKLEKMLAGLETGRGGQDGAKANGAGPQPRKRSVLRREYPDLVTLEPAEDDEGRVRRGLASDRRVAGAEGRSSRRGKEPVLAAHRGAVPGVGADALGGARADASPGDVSAAGLRPQRPGQLAEDSTLRHAEGAEEA